MRGARLVALRGYSSTAPKAAASASSGPKPKIEREIPTDWEQATGPELNELIAEQFNVNDLFADDVLYGAFGTIEKPVVVPSLFDTRIVGCIGDKDHEHDLTWHVVSNGRPLVCVHCAQVFQLQKYEGETLKKHVLSRLQKGNPQLYAETIGKDSSIIDRANALAAEDNHHGHH